MNYRLEVFRTFDACGHPTGLIFHIYRDVGWYLTQKPIYEDTDETTARAVCRDLNKAAK